MTAYGVYNSSDTFFNNTGGLVSGKTYYVRAWGNDSKGFNMSTIEVTFDTLPAYPTSLTVTEYDDTNITLTWVKGADATVLFRNTTIPFNATTGTEVYNGTAQTFTDTGLTPDTHYYYRAYNWDDTWKYAYNNASTDKYTTPGKPLNVTSEVTVTGASTLDLNISWVNGSGSDVTLIKRSTTEQPILPTDGTLVYNSSKNTTIDASLSNVYYYTLWSYSNSSGYYSNGANVTDFFIVWINVYNETNNEAITDYGVFFSDTAGTDTYSATHCNNPHILNVSELPQGDNIGLYVNASMYKSRQYYLDIEITGSYFIDCYLPPIRISDEENETIDTLLYVITVETELDAPIPDAKLIIRKYISGTGYYENVSSVFTDGNGEVNVWLIPNNPYKFDISATNFITATGQDWTPNTLIFTKTFKLKFTEDDIYPPLIPQDYITFTANRTNTSLTIIYDDALLETINTVIYIYEIDLLTGNETLFHTNTTNDTNSFTLTVDGVTANNSYRIVLRYNHTTFGYQTLTILLPGYRRTIESEFDTFMVNIFGYNPFLWSNIIMVLILIAVMFSADKEDLGKILIILGGIFVFITVFIGFGNTVATVAGGILPALFVLVGILMEWVKPKTA